MAKIDIVKDFFEKQISSAREDSPELFSSFSDEVVFAFLCLKYYVVDDSASDEEILDAIVNKESGGELFAICNNGKDGENTTVVATFDFTFGTDFDSKTEPLKRAIIAKRVLNYTEEIKTSRDLQLIQEKLSSCRENSDDAGKTSILHFTVATPIREVTKQNSRKNFEKAFESVPGCVPDMHFGWAIKDWIESALSGDGRISVGVLRIDVPGNCLKYSSSGIGGAVIVNISAKSLQELYGEHGKNLLGLNLRYHVKGKVVDAGIAKTIRERAEWFWCLNNGMVIVCDDFDLAGTTLTLKRFSIVNGGQTTVQISRMDDSVADFFFPCKVIKTLDGETALDSNDIAVASNSQKPIKPGDLAANGKEQIALKAWFKQRGWQYIIKQGEKADKQYKSQKISLDKLGKLVLSSLLQMPWTRSSSKDLYDPAKPYFRHIFGDEKNLPAAVAVYPELIRADKAYNDFTKTLLAKNSVNVKVTNNARTAALALTVYLSYFFQKKKHPVDDFDNIDVDRLLDAMLSLRKIFQTQKIDWRKPNDLFELYSDLANNIFYNAYLQRSERGQDESGFFKSAGNYPLCLRQLRARLANENSELVRVSRRLFAPEE